MVFFTSLFIHLVRFIEASYPHRYCLSCEKLILLVHRSAKQLDSASGQLTLSRHVSCAPWWNNFYRYRGILNPLRFSEELFLSARQLVLLMHAHSESESNANAKPISASLLLPRRIVKNEEWDSRLCLLQGVCASGFSAGCEDTDCDFMLCKNLGRG